MGDRATICIEEPSGHVFLYTHWEGHDLPLVLRDALARKQRWDDPAYLARIIFCAMVKDEVAGETGFGISPLPCGGQYPLLVVETEHQTVVVAEERLPIVARKGIRFEDYIELSDEEVRAFRDG